MVKTKTLTQRVAELEAENAKMRKKLAKTCKKLDKIERDLEAEDNLLPPTLSPEEEKEREDLNRWHRIGI